jgi:polyisoprenoid-binding protein YceI
MVVPVKYTPGKNAATFDGGFVLKRLDFGIGEGMWADVATVANEVRVNFRIAATGK